MKKIAYLILCITIGSSAKALPRAPKMTVVFVIDQLGAHYLEKMNHYLKGGIGTLLKEGVEYSNAFYDASPPSTAHGHTLLTTGTYGSVHGIVGNDWRNEKLEIVRCDDDSAEHAAVFKSDGTLYPYGKSARNMLVDNLSDQLMLHSYPHARNNVWSLSLKGRAAILMAGKMGNPIWLNLSSKHPSRHYTSSKAYFDAVPQWVKNFNETLNLNKQKQITWKPFYPLNSPMYDFGDCPGYEFSSRKKPLINTTQTIVDSKAFKDTYTKTPQATADFFKLAKACVDANYKQEENERFILWLNIATLDKTAHDFGIYSKEALDTLYHIDHQIKLFMEFIYKKVPKEDVLFVLTADHGGQPIPEQAQQKGYPAARRHYAPDIIKHANKLVEKKHGIKELIKSFNPPQFYLNMELIKHLTPQDQHDIMTTIKDYLMSLPGIRKAWTFDELEKAYFEKYDLDRYIKKEIHRGRSGQILYSTDPYTAIYGRKGGNMHGTQYGYDTRVPLIFHQAGRFTKKRVADTRYMTQVSPTLAALLGVPRPSASTARVLPEIVP